MVLCMGCGLLFKKSWANVDSAVDIAVLVAVMESLARQRCYVNPAMVNCRYAKGNGSMVNSTAVAIAHVVLLNVMVVDAFFGA